MSASTYDCPQCGAPVKFQSSVAVFAVCEHCRSMVVRKDLSVESLGVMAELPPDLSPLQLGSRGEWNGKAFELVGRIRVEWDLGSWNEWYALFSDGAGGWVAETQGFYMVSFETKDDWIPQDPQAIRAQSSLELAGKTWSVSDIKSARCRAGEGELPFAAPPGLERRSVDLTGQDGSFASLEFAEGSTTLYVGAYASFDDLHLSNLRPVPGWSSEAPQIRNQTDALNCPTCGAVMNLRALGQTMSAVCGSCGAVVDTANPVWKLVQGADEKIKNLRPLLPIGARGKLQGIDYEVIGLMQRSDSDSAWSEYLLFNPWRGFEWLVTYKGHWSFVHRRPEIGNYDGPKVRYAGHTFTRYARGEAKVTAVLGEFYWKVKRGERALLADYIAPPAVLSKETYPELEEFTWSIGEYIDSAVVGSAFGVKDLPKPQGMYLNQPNPYRERWKGIKGIAILAVIGFTLIQFFTSAHSKQKTVYDVDLTFQRDSADKTIVSPRFQLEGSQQRVEIEGSAELSNNWIGLDFELVNAQTGEVYPESMEIEYYFGTDEDGSWSEGGKTSSVSIPSLPPGEYYLTIEPSADPAISTMPYRVTVIAGGVFWSNYFFGLLLILAYPIYLWFRKSSFETQRWSESDFSPAGTIAKSSD